MKYRNKKVYTGLLVFDYHNDISERDFMALVNTIKQKDWYAFNIVKKELERQGAEFFDVVNIMFKKDKDYKHYELNERTFNLINSIIEDYSDIYYEID